MAKRLTDTTKWNSPGFRALAHKHKLFYLYVYDQCDNAGVMKLDLELIGAVLKDSFTLDELRAAFPRALIFLDDTTVMVRGFIASQNGDIFDSKSKVAASIRATLNSHGLLQRYQSGEFGVVNGAVGAHH